MVLKRAQHIRFDVKPDLVRPVTDEGARADHQVRECFQSSFLALHRRRGENARRLKRLSKTHVVRERTVQLEATQEREPIHTILLIRAQRARTLEREFEVFNLAVVQERLEEFAILL